VRSAECRMKSAVGQAAHKCTSALCTLHSSLEWLPGPRPGALNPELRSAKMADPKGVAPSTLPQTIPMPHRD